ncbi:MAG: thioredoxin family protein [Candidatus Marinimicrobia bacterium]|nr:thioredoxin family protein [Candidatus Neomarinimicrobiota bacterium]MCF7827611.1 thioredoxin family protein [Candidatus Neomarinimicrobiota bacterium]MCF7881528.1 thioredoxin family protein [Candidatus Neomarinimicrobiota bacterium]
MNIESLQDLQRQIQNSSAGLFYFSTSDCNVCKVLKPKVEELLSQSFPKMEFYYIDCEAYPDVAAQFQVFTVPTLIAYFDGREAFRKSRSVGIQELASAIQRPYTMLFDEKNNTD